MAESPRSPRSRWTPYVAAIALVALATVVRLPLEPFLRGAAPYALFYLAVLACAWYWGAGSAVLASLLSAVVAVKVLIPAHEASALPSLIPFAIACVGMVAMARAAREIRSREEKANSYLAAIVQSTDDAILSKDLNGVISNCNPACERIFGYAASELIGRPVTVLIPPELQFQETDILSRLRRGERIDHFETVRMTKQGRRIDVSLTISPVKGKDGEIVGVSKIVRDVTEAKRVARDLAAQQEWFRVTLGSIGDAVIASDPDGKITFLNRAAERLTGWDEDSARARPLSEVFHIINEETRRPADDPAVLVLRTGHIVGLANHTLLVRRDGTECPIADSAAPIHDASGATLGVVLVFHDVTEQRRAEMAVAEQREWFERTLESIGDAVIATDIHCNIVFMNPVAEHLTGWDNADAKGRRCEEIFRVVNEETRQTVENPVRRVLDEGAVVGLANHTILLARDGAERPIDDSGAPIRDANGRIVGAVLVFRDVTEHRNAETERRAAGVDRERLLEAERVARAEAERANRVKDDFLAMVSHELRTPLNAILGWTELLLRGKADPESLRGLEIIRRNTRVQAQLISDLLDVSRIMSGKLLLDVQSLDLVSVIDAAIETVQPMADAKGIEIHRRLDATAARTVGDPARLQQAIWNLLTNAIKFSESGKRIDVVMHRVESRMEISVTDGGVGILPEMLSRVFDRFHQQYGPTTRQYGGLGLGLSIVKHLVELHGGSVKAWSEGEGRGATFTISLPISVRRIPNELMPAAEPGDVGAPPIDDHTLRDLRILLVEDEADTRDLVRRLLEAHGAEVATVANAPEALEAISKTRPHLLVSDVGLPGMDGYELIQRIREMRAEGMENIPAVALTAFTRSEDRTRALRAGYQVHVAKPVEPAELVATLASLAHLIPDRAK